MQQLHDAHVPVRALARGCGLSPSAVRAILDGDRARVQRRTADRVGQLTLAGIYTQPQPGLVPKVGAVRRVQALMAMGWTKELLTQAGASSLPRVLSGRGNLITVDKWRQIKEVYDQVSMTPGPSHQAQARARARGYAPPLAWDEATIDDSRARPQLAAPAAAGGERVDRVAVDRAIARSGAAAGLTHAERIEVIRGMVAAGASDRQIGRHLDVADRTILRVRRRQGIRGQLRHPARLAGTTVRPDRSPAAHGVQPTEPERDGSG